MSLKLFKKRPSKRGSLVDLTNLGIGKNKAPKEEDLRKARDQAQLRAQWRHDTGKLRAIVDKLRDQYASAKGGFAINRYEHLKTMIKEAVSSFRITSQEIKEAKMAGSLNRMGDAGSTGGSIGGTLERAKKSGGLMARLRQSAYSFATHEDGADASDDIKRINGKTQPTPQTPTNTTTTSADVHVHNVPTNTRPQAEIHAQVQPQVQFQTQTRVKAESQSCTVPRAQCKVPITTQIPASVDNARPQTASKSELHVTQLGRQLHHTPDSLSKAPPQPQLPSSVQPDVVDRPNELRLNDWPHSKIWVEDDHGLAQIAEEEGRALAQLDAVLAPVEALTVVTPAPNMEPDISHIQDKPETVSTKPQVALEPGVQPEPDCPVVGSETPAQPKARVAQVEAPANTGVPSQVAPKLQVKPASYRPRTIRCSLARIEKSVVSPSLYTRMTVHFPSALRVSPVVP